MDTLRYRRRRHIHGSWSGHALELQATASGKRLSVTADQVALLSECTTWRSAEEVAARIPGVDPRWVAESLEGLADGGLLERASDDPDEAESLLGGWGRWAPTAASYHFSTRNSRFGDPLRRTDSLFLPEPQPSPLKSYPGKPSLDLPAYGTEGEFRSTLLDRRSWRQFGRGAIGLGDISTLCGLTWGVQSWARIGAVPRQALKTSPSGGARHSIEAYVAILEVEGVDPGLYHYGPDTHTLTLIGPPVTAETLGRFLPSQEMYGQAGAVVFMTSIFNRVIWRYPDPRAYRNLFIEAGHLAQTFLLTATQIGLAPFCTAALSEDAIEEALGLDGITESTLYAVGVGVRPEIEWAPLPTDHVEWHREPSAYHERTAIEGRPE